jgi:acetate---CoA ligase (ADP-forming)
LSLGNPVDMLATANSDLYARALAAFADAESIDAVIVIYTPTGLDDPAAVIAGIGRGADELAGRVPVLAVALMAHPDAGLIQAETSRTPLYGFPENAVRAVSQAWRYSSWRERPLGHVPAFADTRPHEAAAVIAAALANGEAWLPPARADALLRSYGIELIESRHAANATEVARIAGEWGVPVTVKAVAPTLLHKTESGAVRLGLVGAAEAMRAASDLRRDLHGQGHVLDGFIVQPMAESGTEILVGVVHDAVFGPVVVCGAGGTAAELLADTTARITPLTDLDAHELVTSLRTYRLLDGWRGASKADVPALEEMLLRVSLLVEAHPEIAELDLNPVIVSETGAVAVDVRVRIEASSTEPPWPSITAKPPMSRPRAAW